MNFEIRTAEDGSAEAVLPHKPGERTFPVRYPCNYVDGMPTSEVTIVQGAEINRGDIVDLLVELRRREIIDTTDASNLMARLTAESPVVLNHPAIIKRVPLKPGEHAKTQTFMCVGEDSGPHTRILVRRGIKPVSHKHAVLLARDLLGMELEVGQGATKKPVINKADAAVIIESLKKPLDAAA